MSETAVLLINIGSPKSFYPKDVKAYLKRFLMDPRVIDLPYLLRAFLVKGMIVPRRYKKIAKVYEYIWKKDGSPLMVYMKQLSTKLQEALGKEFWVQEAMCYSPPSVTEVLRAARERKSDKIVILPLFPQHASATTGSVYDAVMKEVMSWETKPDISFISHFMDNPGYQEALYQKAQTYNPLDYDHVLFSFHGLPERHIVKADDCGICLETPNCCNLRGNHNKLCYRAQCVSTATTLAKKLNLPPDHWTISFQSRLGKDPWIKPYSESLVAKFPSEGIKKLLVYSPAFVCDCLETQFELGVELKETFVKNGGEELVLAESLNADPLWIEALSGMLKKGELHAPITT